jgi:MFS family permease
MEFEMKKFVTAAVAVAALGLVAAPASAQVRDKVGTLNCTIAGGVGFIVGSQKRADCTFTPDYGRPERYVGTLSKIGVDIGVTTATEIVWAVAMTTEGRRRGALAGSYVGATGEATVVGGVGANVLVGGSNRTVSLQPLSLQGQTGLNVAGGIGELRLTEVSSGRAAPRRKKVRRNRR